MCLIERGKRDGNARSVVCVGDCPCVQTDRSMLPFHGGAKESHGVQGQLAVTAFR